MHVCKGGWKGEEGAAKSPTKGPTKSSSKELKEVAVTAENLFDRLVSNIASVFVGEG